METKQMEKTVMLTGIGLIESETKPIINETTRLTVSVLL
jgi:hypothetical protein